MVYINTTGKHNEVWLDKPYATITVECPECPSTEDAYNSGWTDGSEDGYHKGYQSGRTDGYDDGWGPGYESGYTDGLEACSGSSCNLSYQTINLNQIPIVYNQDTMHYEISGSTPWTKKYTVFPLSGYDGMALLDIVGSIDGYYAYADGFDKGQIAGAEGEKAKLTYSAFTRNGYYSRSNGGWSGISIQVPQTGHTDQEMQDNWDSGYTSGYTDGLNACSGYTQEDLDAAFASGYSAGLRDCSGYTPATSITLNVDSAITGTGQATVTVNPSDAGTDIAYTSSDPFVATIDDNGVITVHQDGTVTFCAVDNLTQLSDCKIVNVTAGSGETGNYLTLEIKSDGGVVHFNPNSTGSDGKSYDYRINQNNWVENLNQSCEFSVSSGDTVQFRGNDISLINANLQPATFYGTTASFDVHGNIMSMYRKTNFENITTIPVGHSFENFFKDCRGLVSAENLELPATTLQQFCYERMFENCVSLVSAPELPATTLASYCYQYMFNNCTSLTSAPELPALTLTQYCYYSMFTNCSSLEYVKCLATDISAEHSTTVWVDGVSSSGTFVKNSSMTGWSTGYDGIPTGWTVVDAS